MALGWFLFLLRLLLLRRTVLDKMDPDSTVSKALVALPPRRSDVLLGSILDLTFRMDVSRPVV